MLYDIIKVGFYCILLGMWCKSFNILLKQLCFSVHIRDANNISHQIRNLKLSVKEMNHTFPNPSATRKMLQEAVLNCQPSSQTKDVLTFGQYDLQFNGKLIFLAFQKHK